MGIGWLFKYIRTSGFGSSLPNFHQVTPRLYRGGLPKRDGYEKLKNMGVTAVINLIDGDQAEARERATAAGLLFTRIPLSDKKAPPLKRVENFLAIVQGYEKSGAVYVHCRGGRHRTGLLIALYRVVIQGWTKKQAWKEAEKHGFYSELGHGDLRQYFWDFDVEKLSL